MGGDEADFNEDDELIEMIITTIVTATATLRCIFCAIQG
jgi:hypothetical protein